MPKIDLAISLDDKFALDKTRAYMTGIDALVRLPMLQQQRDAEKGLHTAGFVSGYRGSPLGTVDQAMWKAKPYLDKHHIKFMPGVNEDLAATAVWGSQQTGIFEGARYDGVFGMWYGKGPGVDRSMDVIKHANASGTAKFGGVLAVAGDDHACKSSTLPHQTEHMFIGASIPVLNPANVQEVLDLGVYGWELSRYSGCWVALKAITENMDSAISAKIDSERIKITIPEDFQLPADGVHVRWPDPPLEQELRLNKYKIYAAREFARVNGLNRVVIDCDKPRLGIITTGKAYLDVMQALEDLGIDEREACRIGLRIFKVGMSWPLEPVTTHDFAKGLEEILVIEEKRSIIEDQLTGQLYNWPVSARPIVIGEYDEHGNDLLTNLGELSPAMVARAIASRIRRFYNSESMEKRLEFLNNKEAALARPRKTILRTPHFCSGCPHNTSTRVPEGSRAMAGIGCHYMTTWMPDRSTQTFTHMGGEGVTWVGQAPFTDTPHVFQNLGDGTYFHSGLLAIRQAVASKVNITYKILFNNAVAMTGGQPVDGELTIARILVQLRGEGIARIALVSDDPAHFRREIVSFPGLSINHRDQLDAIQKEFRELPGTTVIVYEQTCAAEKRRLRKRGEMVDPPRRIFINEDVCEGCGDCSSASNCLSILPKETELGRKRMIDQSACNKDYSCVNGFCPSFVSVIGGELRKSQGAAAGLDFPDLPEPALPDLDSPWNIVVTGIGGTGVLTVSSIVAMAAHIEGKGCSTMNQTGLAQKYGSVVSHVRVASKQKDIRAVRIPAGDANLLIGCDLVVTASFDALSKVDAEHSHAVVNEAKSTTAEFIRNPDAIFPQQEMEQAISQEVGSGKVHFIDASAIASQLLGDSIGGNLFLLGFAYQKGLVPVSAEALERALELNNVAVEFNKQAFVWGRRAAVDSDEVKRLARIEQSVDYGSRTLEEITRYRQRALIRYQDEKYAQSYLDYVERVKSIEAEKLELNEDDQYLLTEAVARYLFKLMAYKDEYEVARLYTDGEFLERLNARFSGDFSLKFHFALPLISRRDPDTGHRRKLQLPGITFTLLKGLAKLKGLRGTALDLFGWGVHRKRERAMIEEYRETLDKLLINLDRDKLSTIIEIASLPEQLRGYGHVKNASMEKYETAKAVLLKKVQ